MATPASIGRHPIHPMLIVFPIGLWVFSLVCDLIYALEWGGAIWHDMALLTMSGGIIGGLLAAVPGVVDYLSISDPPLKRVATAHMLVNGIVLLLFAVNVWLRLQAGTNSAWPLILSIMGVVLLGISGWLGGTMVYVHGMGVEPQAIAQVPERESASVAR